MAAPWIKALLEPIPSKKWAPSSGIGVDRALAGVSLGSATAEGDLRVTRGLEGVALGSAEAIGSLRLDVAMVGVAEGSSAVEGDLGVGTDWALDGPSEGSSAVEGGDLTVIHYVDMSGGESLGQASAEGGLDMRIGMTGTAAGVATVTSISYRDEEMVTEDLDSGEVIHRVVEPEAWMSDWLVYAGGEAYTVLEAGDRESEDPSLWSDFIRIQRVDVATLSRDPENRLAVGPGGSDPDWPDNWVEDVVAWDKYIQVLWADWDRVTGEETYYLTLAEVAGPLVTELLTEQILERPLGGDYVSFEDAAFNRSGSLLLITEWRIVNSWGDLTYRFWDPEGAWTPPEPTGSPGAPETSTSYDPVRSPKRAFVGNGPS